MAYGCNLWLQPNSSVQINPSQISLRGPKKHKVHFQSHAFWSSQWSCYFCMFIHDMDETWNDLARTRGIVFDLGTGTRIIVDDILSWASTFEIFIKYLECQLEVCMPQNLSLSLKTCLFCPERMGFVGHDICSDGNQEAQSKHSLLKPWPPFKVARDIHSFFWFPDFL